MAQLTTEERLAKIKDKLGLDGSTYHDTKIQGFIDDVIFEMIDGGVTKEVAESDAAVGCIFVGVNDYWNTSSGDVKHSELFYRRLTQLATGGVNSNNV